MPKSAKRIVKKAAKKSAVVECPRCGQRVIPSAAGICPSCYKPMSAVRAAAPARPEPVSAKLYSPLQILFLSFFTGYPTGLVLSSVNWVRMGLTGTAVVYWIAGVLLMMLWGFAIRGLWFGVIIQLGFSAYLYQQMKQSIERFTKEGNEALPASWKSGCAATAATLIILFVAVIALGFLLTSGQ